MEEEDTVWLCVPPSFQCHQHLRVLGRSSAPGRSSRVSRFFLCLLIMPPRSQLPFVFWCRFLFNELSNVPTGYGKGVRWLFHWPLLLNVLRSGGVTC
ncbi:hypothetical protein CEXT_78941 [Caerostris extrusa]|uniref:Uncharacterized protein n=1 Tax=Caerostris extrusa TaxID=172846 RepID=A0AAV4PR76_CAEEX|nr:hypothetical protein CEXT_78941 [Caerostris extrusa]